MLEALPQEISSEITSRLSLISLINSTRVSNLWRSLISNPLMSKPDPTYFVLFDSGSARFAIFDYDHKSAVWMKRNRNTHNPKSRSYKSILPCLKTRGGQINILGSCNGLICFTQWVKNETMIFVYNPTLGETVTIPCPYPEHHDYVFGFCPNANQYKLLAVSYIIYGSNYGFKPDVQVYTLGSDQGWRRIRIQEDHLYHISSEPVCGGGVIYWPYVYGRARVFLNFDLGLEEFGSVPKPPIGYNKYVLKLAYLDHSLIATTKIRRSLDMELWVFKESCWTLNWALPGDYIDFSGYSNLVPAKIFGDGRVLMMDGERLYLYRSSAEETRLVSIVAPSDCTRRGWWSGLFPYTPSLVSPKELMEGVILSQNKDKEAPSKRKPKSCVVAWNLHTNIWQGCKCGTMLRWPTMAF